MAALTSDSSVQTAMAWALPQNCFGLWVQRCLECGCACPSMACIRQHAWNCMVSFDIFLGHHASANKNAREARHIHPMHGGSVHAEWSRAEPRLQVFAQHQALELSVMKISDLKVCIFPLPITQNPSFHRVSQSYDHALEMASRAIATMCQVLDVHEGPLLHAVISIARRFDVSCGQLLQCQINLGCQLEPVVTDTPKHPSTLCEVFRAQSLCGTVLISAATLLLCPFRGTFDY